MEFIGYSLSLPMSDESVISFALKIYQKWLGIAIPQEVIIILFYFFVERESSNPYSRLFLGK
jgi:hypothetical protein